LGLQGRDRVGAEFIPGCCGGRPPSDNVFVSV